MLRREAMVVLAGAGVRAWAASPKKLDSIVGEIPGTALLVDVASYKLLAVHAPELAGALLVPPGSAIKPFTIAALLQGHKCRADENYLCPEKLEIGGRSFRCSHPPLNSPMHVSTALSYSCNCFVAHFAQRFAPGELAAHLLTCGLATRSSLFGDREGTGRVQRAESQQAQQLQAIGEGSVLVTPAGMAMAYRRLAVSAHEAIRSGLEGAVEFGTAQQARVAGRKVAGKTGSARSADGNYIAWFCGFAPSRDPSVAVTVMLQARSGGADAAPLGGRILEAYFAGHL